MSNTKIPESSNNTNHSAVASRAYSYFTETRCFLACFCCQLYVMLWWPIAVCIWVIPERTPNLANMEEKMQNNSNENSLSYLVFQFLRCLHMFLGVLVYCFFPYSSRFVGFILYRTRMIKISKSTTTSDFITISQESIKKQMKALSIFFTVVEIQRILIYIENIWLFEYLSKMLGTGLWKHLTAINMSHDLIKWFPTSFHTVVTFMTFPTVTSPSLFPFNLSQEFGTFVVTE